MFLPQQRSTKSTGVDAARSAKEQEAAVRLRPWVEKYRPKTIEDVTAQEHTVNVLRKSLLSTNLPHMLFYGPPGTGKTSTILALARQLFGPELMKSRVLELNASDERGISVVREKIKNFAKLAVSNANINFPCPPYKIVILDEADSMTHDAQSALRRIMEQYSRITRFCLVCNYVTRIIEPLASRCSKFRFRTLDTGSTKDRLQHIAEAEGVKFDEGVLDTLITTSDGDLRRAITYLQSASRLHSSTTEGATPISALSIVEIAGVVPQSVIHALARAVGIPARPDEEEDEEMPSAGAKAKMSSSSAEFDRVREKVRHVARQGYSTTQLMIQLHDYVMQHETLTAARKAKCALEFGHADKDLTDGADEELQLLNLCLKIKRAVS